MSHTVDIAMIPPEVIGRYLKATGRIGKLELRQAAFFSRRLPNEEYRDDLHLLLLLLLILLFILFKIA